MKIIKATENDIPLVQKIFKEYQDALNEPVCFQNFEKELDGLLGLYASPTGVIFLAIENDVYGCVAVRPLLEEGTPSKTTAEFKRLYVQDAFKGKGVGKQLFQLAMNEAEALGYQSIVLETMDKMELATKLYLNYGFKPIPAYFDNADEHVKFYKYDF